MRIVDLKGYEKSHLITENGYVVIKHRKSRDTNARRNKGVIPAKKLKGAAHSNGYVVISIKGKKHFLHRLIAETFIPNPNGLPEVNHKDGNKKNNHFKNLEWVTRSENQQHALSTGLRKVILVKRMLYSQVFDTGTLNYFKEQGRDPSSILKCCKGKLKSHHGYHWKFATN